MSPAKVQNFMLGWLPRKVLLSVADQNAMPHAVDGLDPLVRQEARTF